MSLQRFRMKQQRPNYFLSLLVFLMVVFGLIMIYSASVVVSYQNFGYNYYYLNKQAASLLVGIVAWFIFAKIDYRVWQKYSFWALLVTLVLLVAVFIPNIGLNLGGAHRWITLGPIFFQPSEVVKLTFIIYLSAWLAKKGEGVKDFQSGFIPFIMIVGLIVFLIMKEPDMGTMSVIAGTSMVMFFVAGATNTHLGFGFLSAGFLFWLLIKSSPYRFQRLMVFLNPKSEALGAAYHINQALLAIGSGGLLGLGFGQSKQKYLYLPQSHTDSIFAIIVEELGFLRASLVIIAFIILGYIGYKIAKTAPDSFSKFLATGITTWFVLQAFLNISAMLGVVPLTGVPLPFISYGGSALVVSLAAVGILMNISKQCNK